MIWGKSPMIGWPSIIINYYINPTIRNYQSHQSTSKKPSNPTINPTIHPTKKATSNHYLSPLITSIYSPLSIHSWSSDWLSSYQPLWKSHSSSNIIPLFTTIPTAINPTVFIHQPPLASASHTSHGLSRDPQAAGYLAKRAAGKQNWRRVLHRKI